MPSRGGVKYATRYYLHRFWSSLVEMSGVGSPIERDGHPESFTVHDPDLDDQLEDIDHINDFDPFDIPPPPSRLHNHNNLNHSNPGHNPSGHNNPHNHHQPQFHQLSQSSHHNPSSSGRRVQHEDTRHGVLRHGMNTISMERLNHDIPPPSSFNGPNGGGHGPPGHGPMGTTGYNYQQPHRPQFSKRKQSLSTSGNPFSEDGGRWATKALTMFSFALCVVTFPFSLFFCIKVVQEYERAVIFRLGRLVKGGAKGPGIFFIIPCIDTYSKADLRTVSFDVPPQEILSRDSVTVAVDAVVYFRISNAIASVSNVEDYARSTRLLAATTLRNVLGTKNLSEILSERESISHMIQSALDDATDTWGVKVERVEIKDVRLPVQLQRAMAAEAEAAREARAKVIAAEGEQRASRALKEAADVISQSPAALQLRYLHTLNSIAAEKNSTIVFPVPIEMFRGFTTHTNVEGPLHPGPVGEKTILGLIPRPLTCDIGCEAKPSSPGKTNPGNAGQGGGGDATTNTVGSGGMRTSPVRPGSL